MPDPPKKKRPWLRWLGFGLLFLVLGGAWFVWWWLPGTYAVDRDIELPARFADGLVHVEPETANGAKLRLLADTGGALFLTSSCAERCGISTVPLPGGRRARLPALRPDAWIPEPTGGEKWMPIFETDGDGMVGQRWFAGGVWTFDYPQKKLILRHTSFTPTDEMAAHDVPLGFRHEWGIRTSNHPRMVVTVAGTALETLLDTGATVWLSAEARRVVGDKQPSERATSFVAAKVFRQWREAHPKWRVVEKGCERTREALIEVPEMEVAGFKAGPVWFTRRDDENYRWMSSFMDRPIVASIGGNFLGHFRMTVDYPNAVAWFEKGG
jgi:hypothetical protein